MLRQVFDRETLVLTPVALFAGAESEFCQVFRGGDDGNRSLAEVFRSSGIGEGLCCLILGFK